MDGATDGMLRDSCDLLASLDLSKKDMGLVGASSFLESAMEAWEEFT